MDDKTLMSVTPGRLSTAAVDRVTGTVPALKPVQLNTIDDLLQAVHELLIDTRLEVSVVTPLIYSLLETYVDRFRQYPFDDVSLLLSRLELDAYPEHALRELIRRIDDTYRQYHGEALRCLQPRLAVDAEFEGLRQSLKYAAKVAEQEQQHGGGDGTGQPVANPASGSSAQPGPNDAAGSIAAVRNVQDTWP